MTNLELAHRHLRWAIASLKDASCQAKKAGETASATEIDAIVAASETAKANLRAQIETDHR